MKCRYLYSACVLIETPKTKILCDPWFGDNAFLGAWGQYPKIDNPISEIGPVDLIYISHVHDDHFDPIFLNQYLKHYPNSKVIIGETSPPLLRRNLQRSGIPFEEIKDEYQFEDIKLLIVPNKANIVDLDTALCIKSDSHCIVNMNDNPVDENQIKKIKNFFKDRIIDLALLPYTGAGPYPSMYNFDNSSVALDAAQAHNQFWLDAFDYYANAFKPKYILPFAGKYWLTDNFSNRNSLKINLDPLDLKKDYKNVLVLDDGGKHYIDLNNNQISKERDYYYDVDFISKIMKKQKHKYKNEISIKRDISRSIEKLLHLSALNANKMLEIQDTFFVFRLKTSQNNSQKILVLDSSNPKPYWIKETEVNSFQPRYEIEINPNLFFGLLSGVYIWQSVEYLALFKRVPDKYCKAIDTWFHHLHI